MHTVIHHTRIFDNTALQPHCIELQFLHILNSYISSTIFLDSSLWNTGLQSYHTFRFKFLTRNAEVVRPSKDSYLMAFHNLGGIRRTPDFYSMIAALNFHISKLRVNENGKVCNNGAYSLQQYFQYSSSTKCPILPDPYSEFTLDDPYNRTLGEHGHYSTLYSSLSQLWYNGTTFIGNTQDEILRNFTSNPRVVSVVEVHFKYLQLQLLWNAVFQGCNIESRCGGYSAAQTLQILRRYLVKLPSQIPCARGDRTQCGDFELGKYKLPLLLEDLLLDTTEYGAMLKEGRFGDASQMLECEVEDEKLELMELIAMVSGTISKLLHVMRRAYAIQYKLNKKLLHDGDGQCHDENVLRDMDLAVELVHEIVRDGNTAKLEQIQEVIIQNYRMESSLLLIGTISDVQGLQKFTTEIWLALAGELGVVLQYNHHHRITAAVSKIEHNSKNYYLEVEKCLHKYSKYQQLGLQYLVCAYYCIHCDVIFPLQHRNLHNYIQGKHRTIFYKLKTYTDHLISRHCNVNEVLKLISKIEPYQIPRIQQDMIDHAVAQNKMEFYGHIYRHILHHYIHRHPRMREMCQMMYRFGEPNIGIQVAIITLMYGHFNKIIGMPDEEDFIISLELPFLKGVMWAKIRDENVLQLLEEIRKHHM